MLGYHHKNDSDSELKSFMRAIFKGTALSLFVTALVLMQFSLIIVLLSPSDGVIMAMSLAVLSVFSYLSAYISTQIYRSRGLLQGIICGLLPIIPATVISCAVNGYLSDYMLIKGAASVIMGAAGGVVGVNTKKTKPR